MKTVRIENGMAVASNKFLIIVERLNPTLGNPPGVVHIPADPMLIEKCKAEVKYHSNLFVNVLDGLGMASAKTTLGYIHPGNALYTSPEPNELDRWRVNNIPPLVMTKKSAMRWDAACIADLAASSPSGFVTFPDVIDATQRIVVRCPQDPNWFGLFLSHLANDIQEPAKIPEWFK
jgi:hypothetical protein